MAAAISADGSTNGSMVHIDMEQPSEVERLRLPAAVDRRLRGLLDKLDRGETLGTEEAAEAEGLVELAEFLTLLRRRAGERGSQP